MSGDIKHGYFSWLYHQVFKIYDLDSPMSYVTVCERLHKVPFDDSVPKDDNRAADGVQLRDEFISTLRSVEVEDYAELQSLGRASLFEMLIGLARRADYIVEWGVDTWFRAFLENLGLTRYNDAEYVPRDATRIYKILTVFNSRTYSRNGRGGVFPLKRAKEDQRQVELWYQMAAYMTENQMY